MAYEPKNDIEMAAKRRKAEEIVTKLRQVDVLNAQRKSMAEAMRSIDVTKVTYYRWRTNTGPEGRSGEAPEGTGSGEYPAPCCCL
jgi:ACT domain-containing protein